MTDPVDAATVLLLRDGPRGLEVLLLERHIDSDFAGGAFVFPGGKVDPGDRDLHPSRWEGLDLPGVAARMEVTPDLALGLHVAAVRETFEEAGVLLARREDGAPLDLTAPSLGAARRRLAARDQRGDWRGWLADEGLVLDLGALAWWSWWVTPEGAPKRYDTRFFAALARAGDVAGHDRSETTDARWMTPADALDAGRGGRVRLVYPTRKNLAALARFARAEEAWRAAAEGRTDTCRIVPETVVGADGVVRIRHPHEPDLEPF